MSSREIYNAMDSKDGYHKIGEDKEWVKHPEHYGGKSNPYEAIKVIEAWDLGFNLGNTVKYLSRAGKKDNILEELEKAAWYLKREIKKHKKNVKKTTEQSKGSLES